MSVVDPIDAIWPEIVKTFASYGKTVIARFPRGSRRKQMQARLAEGYEPQDFIHAIHGYLHDHHGFDKQFPDGTKSGDYFRPDTIFKESRFELRVELGLQGRWHAPRSSRRCHCTHGTRPIQDRHTGTCSSCDGYLSDYQKSHCDFVERQPLRAV